MDIEQSRNIVGLWSVTVKNGNRYIVVSTANQKIIVISPGMEVTAYWSWNAAMNYIAKTEDEE